MTTKYLRNFILGISVVSSTKVLKKVIPAAREFDLRKKKDYLKLYAHLTQQEAHVLI